MTDHAAIGNDHERIVVEQLRNPGLVMLHLVEGAECVRLFLVRILQLNQHDGKPVQVDDDVRSSVILPANRQLIHDAEIIFGPFVLVPFHDVNVLESFRAVVLAVFLLETAR